MFSSCSKGKNVTMLLNLPSENISQGLARQRAVLLSRMGCRRFAATQLIALPVYRFEFEDKCWLDMGNSHGFLHLNTIYLFL